MSDSTPFEVWVFDGAAPELLGRAESMGAGRRLWSHNRHAAIASGGKLLDVRSSTGDSQARAIERAAAAAYRGEQGLPALPERRPFPTDRPVSVANGTLTAKPVAAPKAAPKPRPAPAAAPPPAAVPDESAQVQLVRERAVAAEAKVAELQRLLGTTYRDRDTQRERAEAAERTLEQCRDDGNVAGVQALDEISVAEARAAEAEQLVGLTMAAGLAACEALRVRALELDAEVVLEGDRALRAEAEVEHLSLRSADDYQRGLAEGRARERSDTNAMCRQVTALRERNEQIEQLLKVQGEQLVRAEGAETNARNELRADFGEALGADENASTAVLLDLARQLRDHDRAPHVFDERSVARIATLAARQAVRASRDDQRLRALALSVGGGRRARTDRRRRPGAPGRGGR